MNKNAYWVIPASYSETRNLKLAHWIEFINDFDNKVFEKDSESRSFVAVQNDTQSGYAARC